MRDRSGERVQRAAELITMAMRVIGASRSGRRAYAASRRNIRRR